MWRQRSPLTWGSPLPGALLETWCSPPQLREPGHAGSLSPLSDGLQRGGGGAPTPQQARHSKGNQSLTALRQPCSVWAQAARRVAPRPGTFDQPPPRQQHNALGRFRTPRDTEDTTPMVTHPCHELSPRGPSDPAQPHLLTSPPRRAKRRSAPAGSDTEAAVTMMARRSPSVSIRRGHLRPLTLLPFSQPRSPPSSVVCTLWRSRQPAVGCWWRPACGRPWARKVSWSRGQTLLSRHGRTYQATLCPCGSS